MKCKNYWLKFNRYYCHKERTSVPSGLNDCNSLSLLAWNFTLISRKSTRNHTHPRPNCFFLIKFVLKDISAISFQVSNHPPAWEVVIFSWNFLLSELIYHTIPHHTIPYGTIRYHTIPYHTIPIHTYFGCFCLCFYLAFMSGIFTDRICTFGMLCRVSELDYFAQLSILFLFVHLPILATSWLTAIRFRAFFKLSFSIWISMPMATERLRT